MLVSRISPAPSRAASSAQRTASSPVPVRPPCTKTSQPPASDRLLTSIATTIACRPQASLHRRTRSGVFTAAVLMLTLSAPAASSARTSSSDRTPPPTVSGTNVASAVRFTTSSKVPRPSCEAAMSSSAISSAPSASYRRAHSTGSPASRRPTKRTPLTTRPSRTSRHGMTRFASIVERLTRRYALRKGAGNERPCSARVGGRAAVRFEQLLDRREAVLDRVLHDRVHGRARALERLVVALPLRRVDDRRRVPASQEQQIHDEPRHLSAVDGEREDAQHVVVGARGEAHGRSRPARLGVVHPVDHLAQLVRDLVGRGVLVEVEPVLRDVFPVFHRLRVPL